MNFSSLDFSSVFLLVLAGLGTGFLNTVAGGGSLLTLPILIFLGLPSTLANGTNRVGIFFQSISALAGFKSKNVTSLPYSLGWSISALFGAIIGAWLALKIDTASFNKILSFIVVAVVVIIVWNPKFSTDISIDSTNPLYTKKQQIKKILLLILFFFVGIYAGFIQAGSGYFMIAICTGLAGFDLHKANHAKMLVTLFVNTVALCIFLWNGQVYWLYGIILAISSSIGSWLTSRWSAALNEKYIRFFLVASSVAMSVKLFFYS